MSTSGRSAVAARLPLRQGTAEDARHGSERANRENRGSRWVAGQTGVSCEVTPEPLTPAPPGLVERGGLPGSPGLRGWGVAVGVQWRGCEDAAADASPLPVPGGLVWRP